MLGFSLYNNLYFSENLRWVRTQTKQNLDGEFYNRSMKSCLQDSNIEMHPTSNEGKSVVSERFIRTLKKRQINIWLKNQRMCILIN